MFGSIGSLEILLILVVALLVVGPKRLPQVARTLGKTFGEFKRMTGDVQRTITAEVDRVERQERTQKAKRELMPEESRPKAKAAEAEAKAEAPAAKDEGKVVVATEPEAASETTEQPAKGA